MQNSINPYVFDNVPIENLNLSTRSNNCLRRNGIHTIYQLLSCSEEQLSQMRNMGSKSLQEIKEVIKSIVGESQNEQVTDNINNVSDYLDTPIEHLNLSTRLFNCLKRAHIDTVGGILDYTKISFTKIKNMGDKTICELQQVLDEIEDNIKYSNSIDTNSDEIQQNEEQKLLNFIHEYSVYYSISIEYFDKTVMQIYENNPQCSCETFVNCLYKDSNIRYALKNKIKALFKNEFNGMTIDKLHSALPHHLINTTIIEEILIELEDEKTIIKEDDLYINKYPTLTEYIDTITNDKYKTIINSRLSGKTLQEIGENLNMTRERIRQIISNIIRKTPYVVENKYKNIFSEYSFDKESFCRIFNEPEQTYIYLEISCIVRGKNRKLLNDFLEDETIPLDIRRRAESYVYRDYLLLDNKRIHKSRPELFDYVVKKYCRDKKTFNEAIDIYNQILAEYNLDDCEDLRVEARTYENRMASCDYVLWNMNHSFRYYDIKLQNYSDLINEINLSQYQNTEMTTLKIFREHQTLMVEYDIHDEYELHNLLKKIWDEYGDCQVEFSKMPTIRIGEVNRDQQVIDLLMQCAPISKEDFADRFEEEYGFRAATSLGLYFNCIYKYLGKNGVYEIEHDELPTEYYTRMKEVLIDDFYMLSDIQRIYQREFPDAENRFLSTYHIKKIGFQEYSNYVVSNKYSSAFDYFKNILTKDDIVDTNQFSCSSNYIVSYYAELYDLKNRREIIEFAPKQYINIRRLEEHGITKEKLLQYCTEVYDFVGKDNYFTIASLRNNGFEHELDDLYFDEWFYSSVLIEDREHFSYRRMGGDKLIYSGKEKNVTFLDFIECLIQKEERIDIYDLKRLLSEQYGLNISKDDLVWMLKDTDLYYDHIMEVVYVDYNTYYEEV